MLCVAPHGELPRQGLGHADESADVESGQLHAARVKHLEATFAAKIVEQELVVCVEEHRCVELEATLREALRKREALKDLRKAVLEVEQADAIREVMDKLEEMMVRPVKDIDVIESEIGSLVGRRLNVDGMSSINAKVNADLDAEIGRHRMVEQGHSVRKMRIQSKADREIGNVRAEIATLTAAQAQHENEMYELEMRRARRLEEEASYQQRVTAMEEELQRSEQYSADLEKRIASVAARERALAIELEEHEVLDIVAIGRGWTSMLQDAERAVAELTETADDAEERLQQTLGTLDQCESDLRRASANVRDRRQLCKLFNEEILRLRRLLWVKKTQKPVSKPTESTIVRSFSVGYPSARRSNSRSSSESLSPRSTTSLGSACLASSRLRLPTTRPTGLMPVGRLSQRRS